jgi:hypothetical protein
MDFTKLSEVEAIEEVPEGASVLAEVNGAIKRISGGMQADWDETDETSPAFILNKPEISNVSHYYYMSSYPYWGFTVGDDGTGEQISGQALVDDFIAGKKVLLHGPELVGDGAVSEMIAYKTNESNIYISYINMHNSPGSISSISVQ